MNLEWGFREYDHKLKAGILDSPPFKLEIGEKHEHQLYRVVRLSNEHPERCLFQPVKNGRANACFWMDGDGFRAGEVVWARPGRTWHGKWKLFGG